MLNCPSVISVPASFPRNVQSVALVMLSPALVPPKVLLEESELNPPPPPDAAANPASPLESTVRTCPLVGVPPLSFRTTLIPGILNLVILESPIVTVLLSPNTGSVS